MQLFFSEIAGKGGVKMRIIPYEERYRDDMIFMTLEAKDALGLIPTLREDLLDVRSNYLDTGDGFWLALRKDRTERERVVGCIGYRSTAGTEEVFLHRFFVKAALKRQGIGTVLLHTAEEAIRAAGKTSVRVHLGEDPEIWFESRAFYRKHGYLYTDETHMEKRLQPVRNDLPVFTNPPSGDIMENRNEFMNDTRKDIT